jgi:choline dehydrogenase
MISMRGQAADYDHWRQLGPERLGLGRRAAGVPAARGSFPRRERGITASAAAGGSRRRAVRWDLLDAVRARRGTMPASNPFRTSTRGDNEGVGYFHVNQKRGRRWSSARAFLKPVLRRPNLRLETGVLVDRLMFERGAPPACAFSRRRGAEAPRRGEVILCAGSIGSPQMLHRCPASGRRSNWRRSASKRRARPAGRRAQSAGSSAAARMIYKVDGITTLNETLSFAAIRRGMMGSNMHCSAAAAR